MAKKWCKENGVTYLNQEAETITKDIEKKIVNSRKEITQKFKIKTKN